MFEEDEYFHKALIQVIQNLKNFGIDDITKEVVGLQRGSNKRRFQFYTEDQWKANPANKANEATILFGKHYEGFKYPDYVVKHEGVTYFVVNVK